MNAAMLDGEAPHRQPENVWNVNNLDVFGAGKKEKTEVSLAVGTKPAWLRVLDQLIAGRCSSRLHPDAEISHFLLR